MLVNKLNHSIFLGANMITGRILAPVSDLHNWIIHGFFQITAIGGSKNTFHAKDRSILICLVWLAPIMVSCHRSVYSPSASRLCQDWWYYSTGITEWSAQCSLLQILEVIVKIGKKACKYFTIWNNFIHSFEIAPSHYACLPKYWAVWRIIWRHANSNHSDNGRPPLNLGHLQRLSQSKRLYTFMHFIGNFSSRKG